MTLNPTTRNVASYIPSSSKKSTVSLSLPTENQNLWKQKMSGFLVDKQGKLQEIEQEDEKRKKLLKKIEVEMNSDEEE